MNKKENSTSHVSLSNIDKLIKSQQKEASTIHYPISDSETLVIQVKPMITLREIAKLVTEVVDSVFIKNKDLDMIYSPFYRTVALHRSILAHYTNFKSQMDLEKLYSFTTSTTLMEKIYDCIEVVQLDDILNNIDSAIEYKKQELLSQERKELQKGIAALEEYIQMLSKVGKPFQSIDPNQMIRMVETLNNWEKENLTKEIQESRMV